MKIFLDTADIEKIRQLSEIGIIDGVTTNPSIIAKSGRKFESVIAEICQIVEGPVSAEVISTNYEGMIAEALKLKDIAPNVCIKLPITQDGIKACYKLSSEDISVNMTLCFSLQQALLCAKVGASFVSPFVGRLDDIGQEGINLIAEIRQVYDNYGFQTEILAASIRNIHHFVECAKIGADVVTAPPSIVESLFGHHLTNKGLEMFLKDWQNSSK